MTREEARQVLESAKELRELPFQVGTALVVALNALKEEEGKKKRWKPESGEVYWKINKGEAYPDTWLDEDYYDERAYKLGNCYRTEEECEFAIECKLVEQELKDYACEHNEGEIVWDEDNEKFYLSYSHLNKGINIIGGVFFTQHTDVYFTSKEIAKDAIKAIGEERLKKYYFKVVEE